MSVHVQIQPIVNYIIPSKLIYYYFRIFTSECFNKKQTYSKHHIIHLILIPNNLFSYKKRPTDLNNHKVTTNLL